MVGCPHCTLTMQPTMACERVLVWPDLVPVHHSRDCVCMEVNKTAAIETRCFTSSSCWVVV
jgi:hypothetical protein